MILHVPDWGVPLACTIVVWVVSLFLMRDEPNSIPTYVGSLIAGVFLLGGAIIVTLLIWLAYFIVV